MRLDTKKEIKRLVIYFFYDADGIVDRYVPYMLEDINRNCSELFVVVNGKLTPEGRKTFKKLTPNILVRENVGFDVWAYKTALEHYGWDKLAEYDEVIMMNHTIMGPVYPFSEMFEEMNKRDLDFWGINKYHRYPSDPFGNGLGYLPEHIQSHFIAVRNGMIRSPEFHFFWDNRPEIHGYEESVAKHESIFTKKFEEMGFAWDVYVDTTDFEGFTEYPLFNCTVELFKKYRCPIFKRKMFFFDYASKLRHSTSRQAKLSLDFLKNETNYDVSMVWENLLRTCNLYDIKQNLNLSYILPDIRSSLSQQRKLSKVALILHIFYEDMIQYCYQYALSIPDCYDIYITSDTNDKLAKIKTVFNDGPWKTIHTILIKNRGRDVSALLVGCAPFVFQYDLICFAHDKKVPQTDWGIIGHSFSERCFQNILHSKEYVENVIDLFEKESNLGLLFPPPPNESVYFGNTGHQWGPNFSATQEVLDMLKISVPISEAKEPVAPLGTMFWFRPKALKKLFEHKWNYSDFPREPNKTDGSILHAIERAYPFVGQSAGYYSAWLLSTDYAETETTNLDYMLSTLALKNFKLYGYNYFYDLAVTLDWYIEHSTQLANSETNMVIPPNWRIAAKREIKGKLPKPVWAVLKKIYHFFGGKKWVG